MTVYRTFASLLAAVSIAACQQPAEQAAAAPAVDSAAVKAAVADVWARWSAADIAGNVDSVTALVADSARLDIRGMPPIIGRAAFRTTAETVLKGMDITAVEFMPEMTVAISNELAYETGNYREAYTMGGKSSVDHGRYAAAVGKGADGQWRVMYVMAFADSSVTPRP